MGNRLTDRVAIVTGGGRGIGREVALWLARDGAKVVVNDVGAALDGTGDSGTPADQVVNEIISEGGKAVSSYDSVAEFDSAEQIVNTALNNYGRIDILCHPAGILRDRMIFNMTEAEWDAVLQVHLYGAFNMVRNVAPHMIEGNYGRIVLFSSGSGLGASGQANYAAAKAGLIGLTKTIAKEFGSKGITANAIAPGYIDTDMTANLSDEIKTGVEQMVPLRRYGQPEEIAAAVSFLPLLGTEPIISKVAVPGDSK